MVDYSKWDRFEVSSSDEDENRAKKLRVQRFAERQRVTVGPEGVCIGAEDDKEGKEEGHGIKETGRTNTQKQKAKPGISSSSATVALTATRSPAAPSRRQKKIPKSDENVKGDVKLHEQEEEEGKIDEEQLQKEREELEREKKAEENEIDPGGDLEADEAFEDAHEWPRCGSLAAAVTLPEDWQEEETLEGDHATQEGEERKRCKASLLLGSAERQDADKQDSSGAGERRTPKDTSNRSSKYADGSRRTAAEIALIENGGVVDKKYFWSQSKHDVIVDVLLPWGARGKDVCCDIKESTCCCTYKDKPILKGDFPHKVEEDEEMWLWELVERKVNWTRLQRVAQKHNNSAAALQAIEGHSSRDSTRRNEGATADGREKEIAERQERTEGVSHHDTRMNSRDVSDTTCSDRSASSSGRGDNDASSNNNSKCEQHKRNREKPEAQEEQKTDADRPREEDHTTFHGMQNNRL